MHLWIEDRPWLMYFLNMDICFSRCFLAQPGRTPLDLWLLFFVIFLHNCLIEGFKRENIWDDAFWLLWYKSEKQMYYFVKNKWKTERNNHDFSEMCLHPYSQHETSYVPTDSMSRQAFEHPGSPIPCIITLHNLNTTLINCEMHLINSCFTMLSTYHQFSEIKLLQ